MSEPLLTKDEQYVVAPAKEVRRAQVQPPGAIGRGGHHGANAAFNRNLANRLWAQMMGRGLVHPLDMQHSGNPAVQSQLLALLADELVRMKFDAKAFLRELALTRAYQRSSETPPAEELKLDPAAVTQTLAAWNAEAEQLAGELRAAGSGQRRLDRRAERGLREVFQAAPRPAKRPKRRGRKPRRPSTIWRPRWPPISRTWRRRKTSSRSLVEARDKAQAAAAKLPDDKAIGRSGRAIQDPGRARSTRNWPPCAKRSAKKGRKCRPPRCDLAEADKALQAAAAEVTPARAALDAAEAKIAAGARTIPRGQGPASRVDAAHRRRAGGA